MKKLGLSIFVFVFVVSGVYAQDNPVMGAPTNVLGLNGADEATLVVDVLDINKIEGVFYQFDDIRFGRVPTDGSFLLFDSWNNRAVLDLGQEKLSVSNINFHVDEEKFISEMDNDSTFVYDFKGINRITVNDRPFISMYSSAAGKNKVYEIIAEGESMSLVKNYYSRVTPGSANPMLNRTRNKINLSSNYFVMINGGLLPFNGKKSGMKKILSSDKASKLDAQVKKNKWSYKKEEDLKQIFKYLNTL